MQYETVILELLTRIKTLEEEVAAIKQTLTAMDNASNAPVQDAPSDASQMHQKLSDEMISACYNYGKKLYEGKNIATLVRSVQNETGINRNTAIMYLYAVSAMLKGTVYKRAISIKATKLYFDQILSEYGKHGLKNALKATSLHINYRKECGHKVNSLEALCDQYRFLL